MVLLSIAVDPGFDPPQLNSAFEVTGWLGLQFRDGWGSLLM